MSVEIPHRYRTRNCKRDPAREWLLHISQRPATCPLTCSPSQHFDWSANTLFPEEIPEARDPERTLIVLGGTDIIVDAKVGQPATYIPRSLLI